MRNYKSWKMRNFRNYEVWALSHELTKKIYKVTESFPDSEKYQIIRQMQRAAFSIPSNFAEGCGRESDKDFNRFVQMALGSAHELEDFIILSRYLNYLDVNRYEELNNDVNLVKMKLYALGRKLKP